MTEPIDLAARKARSAPGRAAKATRDPERTRARILAAATKEFAAKGLEGARTDDIARAAELSRPALYLVFRNKTDIYRELARGVLAEVMARVKESLARDGTLLERLDGMVLFAFFDTLREIEEAPHGPELVDMQNALAGDICAEWREEMCAILERLVSEEVAAKGIDLAARELSPRALADVFFDSLEGMKVRFNDPRCHLDAAQKSVRVLVAALRP